jgi:hypothetical protein
MVVVVALPDEQGGHSYAAGVHILAMSWNHQMQNWGHFPILWRARRTLVRVQATKRNKTLYS